MMCEGDIQCRREAEYGVKVKKENDGEGEKYRGGFDYLRVCGFCLVGNYISSNGLKDGVLEVVRL